MITVIVASIWVLGVASIWLRDPYMKWVRESLKYSMYITFVMLLIGGIWLLVTKSKIQHHRKTLACMCIGIGLLAVGITRDIQFQLIKGHVLAEDPALLRKLGRHIIVGYDDEEDLTALIERSAIAGVYLSKSNIQGMDQATIKQLIQRWQALQYKTNGGRLWIAADQEGGRVSKMSPPLTPMPSLSALLNHKDIETQRRVARDYAQQQASELANTGINLNFSPVVDLYTEKSEGFIDMYSRINERSLGSDADTVSVIAGEYCKTSLAQGVMPTLKHFPGIGGVAVDTHIAAATITKSAEMLTVSDWKPFQEVTQSTAAWIMIAHVYLSAIDTQMLASQSHKVITSLLREQWHYQGVVITDDLNMGPAYTSSGGIGQSALSALQAGTDLVLISYDGEQYYKVMDELIKAYRLQQLDPKLLDASDQRLAASREKLVSVR